MWPSYCLLCVSYPPQDSENDHSERPVLPITISSLLVSVCYISWESGRNLLGAFTLSKHTLTTRFIQRAGSRPLHGDGLPSLITSMCSSISETLYHRDDALLYIAYVMLIWAAPIPADRHHCSLWPKLTPWVD